MKKQACNWSFLSLYNRECRLYVQLTLQLTEETHEEESQETRWSPTRPTTKAQIKSRQLVDGSWTGRSERWGRGRRGEGCVGRWKRRGEWGVGRYGVKNTLCRLLVFFFTRVSPHIVLVISHFLCFFFLNLFYFMPIFILLFITFSLIYLSFCTFPCYRTSHFCSWKRGQRRIVNVSNNITVCYACQGDTGTEKTACVNSEEMKYIATHPASTGSWTHATCFH